MIERLFPTPRVRQRLLDGPVGPYVEGLAERLSELGYAEGYIRSLVRLLNSLGEWLEDRGLSPREAGAAELRAYKEELERTSQGRLPEWARGITRLSGWLAPMGILNRMEPASPGDLMLGRFAAYLGNVLGVTPATAKSYGRHLQPLLQRVCEGGNPDWTKMNATFVVEFVLQQIERPNATRARIVSAVRTFLRFLVAERLVPPSLLHAIPRIRRPRNAYVPKRLSAEELDQVLKACKSKENGSVRDRAFIALMARLGVRAGELRHLRLDDIDWEAGQLRIRQSKSGEGRALPMPADAGALLAEYVQHFRPASSHREVFLTKSAPHAPLGAAAATSLTYAFLGRIGLGAPGRCCHCFRHTAATQMVRNGARLKDVADVLGHRSINSTKVYLKLDEPALQEVALPWPGGEA
jgi:integrase/recombinase XerD